MTCSKIKLPSFPIISLLLPSGSIAGVCVVDNLLYAVGGHDGPLVRKSVEVFNPELKTWTQVADMHFCRRNAGKTSSQLIHLGSIHFNLYLNTRCSSVKSQILFIAISVEFSFETKKFVFFLH